jgi:DTW domain-containing protein
MRNRIRTPIVDPLRCVRCHLHTDLCACDLLVPFDSPTELLVVAHRYEMRKATNTGRLAILCLTRARMCVRGRKDVENDPVTWAPERTPLLLFPCPGAIPLDEWKARQPVGAPPVTLIVPDGTWRQAKRVRRRVPGLAEVTAVSLPGATLSTRRIRQPIFDHHLATLEAVALAYGILDGPAAGAHLMCAYRTIVERTLWSNGRLSSHEITTSIPEGASQQGPQNHEA